METPHPLYFIKWASEKGKPPLHKPPPGVLDFCGYFFLRARLAGVGHTLNGSAGIAAVGICFRNQNCAATAPSWQPAAAFSSKPSFAAADQCGFERSFGPPQSKNHLIHVSFLPALEPHLRMNSARFWQLNSWVPLQRDVLYEGRIRGTSEQISCYQALDDCVYFFAQPGRHTKKSIAAVPEP